VTALPACPVCGKPVAAGTPTAPFCRPRCKMVDLGRWLTEAYRIPSEEEVPPAGPPTEERDADDDR
jgi:endogenous inhibitor of DNA gyrase (YacG/DUF329 family)